jgi:hypothetical protein
MVLIFLRELICAKMKSNMEMKHLRCLERLQDFLNLNRIHAVNQKPESTKARRRQGALFHR